MKKLFGVENVELKQTEIYVNNVKGINCSVNPESNRWPLGKIVTENLKNVIMFT
jgi:hypothetical protein